ncbi:MAG: MBL fold metallo-hydrolase [bacterium]
MIFIFRQIIILPLIIISFYKLVYASDLDLHKIKITYIGHATTVIEYRNRLILTDPFFKDKLFLQKRKILPALFVEELPKIDIILISHTHPDHFDLSAIKALKNKPIVVMPWNRGKELKNAGFTVVELEPYRCYTYNQYTITAVPAKHMFGNCLGYIISTPDAVIYFPGDTDLFKGIDKLKDYKIDVMLMPFAGTPIVGSIWTSRRAVKVVEMLKPKTVIPIHWGTFVRLWTPKEPPTPYAFSADMKEQIPECSCAILQVGEAFETTHIVSQIIIDGDNNNND